MLAPLVIAFGSLTALSGPADRPRDAATSVYQGHATVVTGAAAFASVLGIGLSAGGMERNRSEAVAELRDPRTSEFAILPGLGAGTWLLLPGTIANAHGLALSAVAGHLWARHDLERGAIDRRRATAMTVAGTLTLAAGVGLHIAGVLYPGTPCWRHDDDDVEAAVDCRNRTTYGGIAMMTSGAIMFDVGAGLVGYGGTALRARPSLAASRHGATIGVTFDF